jgi:hypothetical protein
MESLPMEQFTKPSTTSELAPKVLPELMNHLQGKLKNSIVDMDNGDIKVSSPEVNTNQYYNTKFPCILLGYRHNDFYPMVGQVSPDHNGYWKQYTKNIVIKTEIETDKLNRWSSKGESILHASNTNAIIDFLISSSTFSNLLQKHVNACTAYIKAVNAYEVPDKEKLKLEAEEVISEFAWEVSNQIEKANQHDKHFKSSKFSEEKMEKYFKSMTKGWTSEEIISNLTDYNWRVHTYELGL